MTLILTSDRATVTGEVDVLEPPADPDGEEGGPFNWKYDFAEDDLAVGGSYTATLEIVWDESTDPPRRQTIPNSGVDRLLVGIGAWHPTVDQVATEWLRARTYAGLGGELAGGDRAGTFTDETTPTADEAARVIEGAISEVLSHFPRGEVPPRSYLAAQHAAIVYAALEIEIGFFPEQSAGDSAFLQLRQLSDQAMATLVNGANVNSLFAENVGYLNGQTIVVGLSG
jgi:hypothetical protein